MNKSTEAHSPLDIRISIIKQAVQRLEEERADFLWELNVLQASTRDLPSEVLAHIFLLASGDYGDHRRQKARTHLPAPGDYGNYRGQRVPLKLAGVCSLWREIALSTHYLWSSLTLHICARVDESTKRQDVVDLLQHYLANAGTVPFSLVLRFDTPIHHSRPASEIFEPSKEILGLLSSILFREVNARKVHRLKIIHAPFEWITSFPKFPNLETLAIHGPTGRLDRILVLPLINSPRLHNLIFNNLRSRGPLPWWRELVPNNVEQMQITWISLARVPANVCVALLVLCPNVTYFESINPVYADIEGDNLQAYGLIDGPIVLRRLEHFGWTHPSPPGASTQTYRRLRFPTLRTFRWYASEFPHLSHLDYGALEEFLPNLPKTISRLEVFSAIEWPMSLVELMFTHGATARDLHLDDCDNITMSNIIIALGRRSAGRGGVYLPQLEKVSIDGIGMGVEPDDESEDPAEVLMAGHIVDTLRYRCQPPNTRFSLELSRRHGVWADEMRKAYWLLQAEGHVGFKIWADSQKLYPLCWGINRKAK
ncbi:hypothetical protein P691DRAFT_803021 [Macrolepiota fuliginosa MF-IS2]|uniref:F-box domain-containing protein n=1 Tax=Macrolepiota fuliginosa MF-IS2 TaxID=1400762 RepID=A0A9P5XAG0_9AGAR|nr:hypothetical protein P691DRAFT_803021 [Macrolepiota fuliginosa MF-IS2]